MISRLAASTAPFDGKPLEQALAAIAATGLQYIEPAFIGGYSSFDEGAFGEDAITAWRAAMAAHGLKADMVSAHVDPTDERGPEMIRRRLSFAAAIGARGIITNAGPATRLDCLRHTLDQVLPVAEDAGVILALENPGHGDGDALGDLMTAGDIASLMERKSLGLNIDAANVLSYSRGQHQPAQVLSKVLPYTEHLHLKDIRLGDADWTFTSLGEGDVDLAGLIRELSACGWSGGATIELPLHLWRPGGGAPRRMGVAPSIEDVAAALRKSLAWLELHAVPVRV